eukprot:scaffold190_cov112-Isochrysis_galbana.AAC.2
MSSILRMRRTHSVASETAENVGHLALAHVDAGRHFARRVPVPQLRHHVDRVQPRVLGQRVRHNLHRLGEGAHAVRVHAKEGVGPLGELVRDAHLGRPAARRQEALLHQAPQHTQRVVQRALGLVQHKLVGRLAQDGDGLARIGHAGDADDLAVARRDLLHQLGLAQLLRVEGVDVGDRKAAARLADELDVVTLNVLDHQDLHLGQEVEREVGDGVAQDGFLDQQHVAPGLLHLLAHVQDVLALLLEDAVHLRVVRDGHVLLNVRLGGGQAELDEADLGVGHLGRAASRVRRLLRED